VQTNSANLAWHTKLHESISAIPEADWDSLNPADSIFTSWQVLEAFESSGSLRAEYGWRPLHLALYEGAHDGAKLIGAVPMYLKANSHGEFVFDHAWANAYERAGFRYFPKLLCAVPYSPVTGARLLGHSEAVLRRLVAALEQQLRALSLSSLHVNFLTEAQASLFAHDDWLPRFDWQFHWHRRPDWTDFSEFIASFDSKKRKNILQERRKVQTELSDRGLTLHQRSGGELSASQIQQVHALYEHSFDEKGNTPALNLAFFKRLCQRLPAGVRVISADRGNQMVAMAFLLKSADTLYGRYWGCYEDIPNLHFECCYYQGIEHALAEKLQRFEPGAQGEHKLARGFLPTRTRSAHLIADPALSRPVRLSIGEEARYLQRRYESLMQHAPYRSAP